MGLVKVTVSITLEMAVVVAVEKAVTVEFLVAYAVVVATETEEEVVGSTHDPVREKALDWA